MRHSTAPAGLALEPEFVLDAVYAHLHAQVRAWIRASVGARLDGVHDTDDIAQDVWLRVAISLPNFDPERGTLRSWVHHITRNTICDRMRALHESRPACGRADEETCLEEAFEREEVLPSRLSLRIARLPDDDRELLRICGLEGRPTTEAARILGLSESAARKRWIRLRRRLAQGSVPDPSA